MANGKEKGEGTLTIHLVRSPASEVVMIWRTFIPQTFSDMFECQIARVVCHGQGWIHFHAVRSLLHAPEDWKFQFIFLPSERQASQTFGESKLPDKITFVSSPLCLIYRESIFIV
jgi:hypothetical protein